MNGVAMLVNEFPPLRVGGAERQAERLAEFMAAHTWHVLVLTRGAPSLPRNERRSGFDIHRVTPLGPGKLKSLTFVLGTILLLWKVRRQYGILHAHLAFGPAFAGAIVGKILGKKVIVKLGNSGYYGDIQTSQRTLRGRLRLAALRRWANTIIVLDDLMGAEAENVGLSQVRKFVNGIDASQFKPWQDKKAAKAALELQNLRPGSFCLLFIGRVERQKSLPTLLKAAAQIINTHPDLHLMMVGDGEERSNLEQLARELGIQEAVTFAGNQADVLPYLNAADAFALPSLSEGISNALR